MSARTTAGIAHLDLPGRPDAEAADELERWRRPAMLGTAVDDVDNGDRPSPFCAIGDRNFSGAARAMVDERRDRQ